MSNTSLTPQVTVIIPVYNTAPYVSQAIESVLSQTFQDFELLIVDDGSTDGSAEIAQRYAAKNPARVKYLEHAGRQNYGVSVTRNVGVRNARGAYIAFLDSDNYWLPEKLSTQITILEQHPEVGVVYCALAMVDEAGLPTTRLYQTTIFGGGIPETVTLQTFDLLFSRGISLGLGSSTLIRTPILFEVGLFDPDLDYGEDEVVACKIAYRYPMFFQPQPLVKFRIHDANCTWTLQSRDPHNQIGYRIMLRTYQWLHQHIQGISDPDVRIHMAQLAVQAHENHAISRWNLWNLLGRIFPYHSANWNVFKIFLSFLLGVPTTTFIRKILRGQREREQRHPDHVKIVSEKGK